MTGHAVTARRRLTYAELIVLAYQEAESSEDRIALDEILGRQEQAGVNVEQIELGGWHAVGVRG